VRFRSVGGAHKVFSNSATMGRDRGTRVEDSSEVEVRFVACIGKERGGVKIDGGEIAVDCMSWALGSLAEQHET
jgi:hypothetical protein